MGHQWDTLGADRPGNQNFGVGQALLGQYTGGSSRARNAAIHPGEGRVKASTGGTGDLSGCHSQALVWEGKAGPRAVRAQGPVSGGNEVLASAEPGPQGPAVHSLAGSAILESL